MHSMQQQVRVLASEKGDLAQQLHSEQTRSRQYHAQVGVPLQPDHHHHHACMVLSDMSLEVCRACHIDIIDC